MGENCLKALWKKIIPIILNVSVEPVFFLDGFAFSIMIVLVESIQFDKICKVNLGYNQTVCDDFDNFPEEKKQYDLQVGDFKRNDGAITSVIPLFFILFIGAWSDKYGRKFPLCLTLFAHILFSGGYLINSIFEGISVEYLYIVGFLDSIGGGAVAFLTVSTAYVCDVTTIEQRTARVALANSLWFLGGPLGTLIGTQIFKIWGYSVVFGTSLALYIIAIMYVLMLLPESYGPFANKKRLKNINKQNATIRLRDTIMRVHGISKKKKDSLGKTPSQQEKAKASITYKKMFKDFFDLKRVVMSFKCVLRKRDGYTRLFIFLLILSNVLRKIGRGAYAFHFTKEVLKWDAEYYGYWVTYKNLVSTLGSLIAVPILSTRLKVSDSMLAMIGSLSSVIDYLLYGLVDIVTSYFIWIAPAVSLLVNSCSIAMRAMMSKYVDSDELGKVSAVTGTMEGIVPVVSTSLYSAITSATFETFPGAQYFFGSACNLIMLLIFIFIIMTDKGGTYDIEAARPQDPKTRVKEKTIVMRTDSGWLREDSKPHKMGLASILLTALNFSIEIPSMEKKQKNREKSSLNGKTEHKKIKSNGHIISAVHQLSNGVANHVGKEASTQKSASSVKQEEGKDKSPNEAYDNKAFTID